VTAVVEGDDAASGLGESCNPTWIDPVDAMVRGEAMNQQDRLAKVAPQRLDVDERDIDAVRRKTTQLQGAPPTCWCSMDALRLNRATLRL
jgi:hypothetical protein